MNENEEIKVRWICPLCGYKSHWFKINKEDLGKSKFCPKRECSASHQMELIIKNKGVK